MSLPQEVQASYVVIIDSILAASDLNTITSKRIREGLQRAVNYDITPQKDAIKALIMMRFDKFVAEQNASPITNGHSEPIKSIETEQAISPPVSKVAQKRKSTSDDESELSNVPVTPPPKKKRKPEPAVDDDAAFAAKLQAEENSRARPTRGGANRKNNVLKKKKKTPKKKTADKIKAEDDSELEGSGSEDKKVNRSGGFHKPLVLSAPLSALLDGEIQLSRPQTVKRIWQYVRERDLQDPKDKRQIRCDEAMRAVFKQDKVHMFTMNKILNQNLYNPEE